jgi:HD-GYP domain-containing protein (c-di-GMP phosphodiesterase class II)
MMPSPQAVEHYLPVAVQSLMGAGHANFDLFIRRKTPQPSLFRPQAAPLADAELEGLVCAGVKTLLIRYSDREAYEQHLHARLTSDNDVTVAGRYRMLTESARSVFETAMNGGSGSGVIRAVHAAHQFGTQLADTICDRKPVLRDLFELMLHDYCTFTHVANVATYCATVARELGISNRAELAQIATGALLHDIGKRNIPQSLLNKTGKLSPAELKTLERHPQSGFEELSENPELTWGQLMMVYQHHERHDGSGYPVGNVGSGIHPWANICIVADIFDGLTSDRPNRRALPVREACDFLQRRASNNFDKETVRCLTAMMQSA